MTGRQVIVAWLVFGLIVMNLVFSGGWTQVKGELVTRAPAGKNAKGPPKSIKIGGATVPVAPKPKKKGNGTT